MYAIVGSEVPILPERDVAHVMVIFLLHLRLIFSVKGIFRKPQIGLSSILQCTGTIKHRLAFLLSYTVQGQ